MRQTALLREGERGGYRTVQVPAFVSYSHRDKAWAEWLHRALEHFRIDPDLVGRASPAGPVPRRLRPIFHDREDFSAGHSLTEQTRAALEGSQFLIVICSPNAAKSHYVNEEIRHFKAIGRGAHVIAVIIDGEPGDAERECFPPALRVMIAPDGTPTRAPEEPIAADARREGDGKRVALLKVVAGLIALPFDDVRKREAIADNRRIKIAAAAVAVVAMLGMAAGYFVWDRQSRNDEMVAIAKKTESTNQATQELVRQLLAASRAEAAPGREQSVSTAVAAITKGAAEGDTRLQQALDLLKAGKVDEATPLLQAFAEDKSARIKQDSKEAATAWRNLGAIAGLRDPKRARDAYARAVTLGPDDTESLFWDGWLELESGDLNAAERTYRLSAIAGPQAGRAGQPRGLLGPARAWRHRAIPRQARSRAGKLPGCALVGRPAGEGRPRQRRLAARSVGVL